jgi:hypothetical protein
VNDSSEAVPRTSESAPSPSSQASVFGIDVVADHELPILAASNAMPTGRAVELQVGPEADVARRRWPSDAELISEQLAPDGSFSMRIEAHPRSGYLIAASGYGSHLLAADGRRVSCAHAQASQSSSERLLIAQTLPFAALLNGLEVFHSSAVVLAGQALAFVGPSRSGKSTLALELCRGGASFLSDDVLALECQEGVLVGHPGSAAVSLDPAGLGATETESLAGSGPPAAGALLGANARERLVSMHGAARPAPLAALFFLDRRADGPTAPRFEPVRDPRALLAATFNFVLASPERLKRLLEVCALAAQQRVERVLIGRSVEASQLADAVRRRFESA